MECIAFNSNNSIGNGDSGQSGTVFKSIILNCGNTGRNLIAAGETSGAEYQFGLILVVENTGCITGIGGVSLVYLDTGHGCTGSEGITGNGSNTGRDPDGCQLQAAVECRIIDVLQCRGQADGGQIEALIEGGAGNAGNTFSDDHFGNLGIVSTPRNFVAHGTGAGNGQLAIAVQYPCQIFTCG